MIEVEGRELAVHAVPAGSRPFTLFPSMGEYPVYDDGVYDSFDARDARFQGYRSAVEANVSGKVVLDVGTGRDALWAVLAARAGAEHVYAVEEQPLVAAQARTVVAEAGLAGRVTVIAGRSTSVSLPARAQVCVSEIVGNIASAEGAVEVLADARERLCTADCLWIPFRIQTWAAAVDMSGQGNAFAVESLPYVARVFAAVGRPFDLRLCLAGPAGDLVVSSAAAVESLVFDHRRAGPGAAALCTAVLTVSAPAARMTGLLLWSRVAVTSGAREIDTLAGGTRGWAPVYVPLTLDGVPVRPGDRLTVSFRRTTSDDGIHPDYHLSVDRPDTAPLTWSSPHHGGGFRGSPLYRDLFPA